MTKRVTSQMLRCAMTSPDGVSLDVNVLLTLLDPAHVQHDPAREWFSSAGHVRWATCPLTEDGVLRVVGRHRYPNSPGSPAAEVPLLTTLCAMPGHAFWPDTLSLRDSDGVMASRWLDTAQLTATYLLALARANQGQLASFDRRLATEAVREGRQARLLIP